MASKLDEFVNQCQRQIFAETKEVYGSGVFERWLQPRFFGKLPNATGAARVTGPCGESMEIYLRIEMRSIKESSFYTDGCGASIACGSVAAELALNKTLDEAVTIGADAIFAVLGELPEEHEHCAVLAAETLQAAIHNHMQSQAEH